MGRSWSPLHILPLSHKSTTFSTSSFRNSSSSSPTSSSTRLKTLIQTLIISHIYRLIREIWRASSILIKVLRKKKYNLLSLPYSLYPKRASKKPKHTFFGSFRLHYNWCSSHVVPVSAPVRLPDEFYLAYLQYESSRKTMESNEEINGDFQEQSQLSSYLEWLDEDKGEFEEGLENEIDKLADMFIANSHEKFMLEKVESYRRFQEMIDGSIS